MTANYTVALPAQRTRAMLYEYAEEFSISRVNRRAGDGWTVHTAGTLPSGDRWYLMQREKT